MKFLALILTLILAIFFVAPIITVVGYPLTQNPGFYFDFLIHDQIVFFALLRSLGIAALVTFVSAAIGCSLGAGLVTIPVRGSKLLKALLLAPLIIPPFVGGIGIRKLLSRYGPLNLILINCNLIDQPIDFIGSYSFVAIVLTESLHFYPVILLTLLASLAKFDARNWEAARILGASRELTVRKIVLPLIAPGLLASCSAVFIWSFSDISTPLVFDYRWVLPVQLLELTDELHSNPYGFWLSGAILFFTVGWFLILRALIPSVINSGSKGAEVPLEAVALQPSPLVGGVFVCFATLVILLAVTPHLMLLLMALGETWWLTPIPSSISFTPFFELLSHPLAGVGLRNSLFLSFFATIFNIVLALSAAYILTTSRSVLGRRVLSAIIFSMMAVPGLILALGSLALFYRTPLDPRINPFPLLMIGYALKRMPFSTQALEASLLSIDRSNMEAAIMCGASRLRIWMQIILPQLKPFIISCAALCFANSMLEVGESFVLALKEPYFPITKALYGLLARPDGERMAAALGIVSMLAIGFLLLIAHYSSRGGRSLGITA